MIHIGIKPSEILEAKRLLSERNDRAINLGFLMRFNHWNGWIGIIAEDRFGRMFPEMRRASGSYEVDRFDFSGKNGGRIELKAMSGNYSVREDYVVSYQASQLAESVVDSVVFFHFCHPTSVLTMIGWIPRDEILKVGKLWEDGERTPFGFTAHPACYTIPISLLGGPETIAH